MKGFYFITDSKLSKAGNISDVKNAVAAGVEVVQLREKNISTKAFYLEALELRQLCANTMLLINDKVDVALAVDADGVHLGQDDLPYYAARKLLGTTKIIGITVHDVEEAKEAEKMGADYIGVSPVFATSTKTDAGRPSGIILIEEIKKLVSLPVIAIGGITLSNAPDVIKAGADGLSAISAVITQPDVKQEIEKFQRLF